MVVKEDEIVWACSRNGGKRIVCRVLVGRPGHRGHNIITETYKQFYTVTLEPQY
jgi:hypothetical protein